ncbi:hypothetical protein SSS_04601 [Sarcoptes scabiei]|nr:hypothetical protein SSS_04601 [Sarcoptes scabiei]
MKLSLFFVTFLIIGAYGFRLGKKQDNQRIGSFGEDGLGNFFREIQIKFLAATETLLDHSVNVYEELEDALKTNREKKERVSSDFKKALRYLKTEARRRKEDIEDEIEIEREKALEAEQAKKSVDDEEPEIQTEKPKKKPIKKILNNLKSRKLNRDARSIDKLDAVSTPKPNETIQKLVNKSVDGMKEILTKKVSAVGGDSKSRVSKQDDNIKKTKVDSPTKVKGLEPKNTKPHCSNTTIDKMKATLGDEIGEKKSKYDELTTMEPVGAGLGDGFGRHDVDGEMPIENQAN